MGISPRVFSFFVAAGGSLPPSGFCPAGNTPLPPLRALKRRARNALAQIPSSREECATFPIADYQMPAPRAISTSCFTFPLADYQTPAPRALFPLSIYGEGVRGVRSGGKSFFFTLEKNFLTPPTPSRISRPRRRDETSPRHDENRR